MNEVSDITFYTIIASVVTAIIGFLFGKTGILNRFFDSRLRKVEQEQRHEITEMEEYKKENRDLKLKIFDLSTKVTKLESELQSANEKIELLMAYFEKVNPTPDPFLNKIIKHKK
jgi:peptidoglycan hydrolase CwlO-like protein